MTVGVVSGRRVLALAIVALLLALLALRAAAGSVGSSSMLVGVRSFFPGHADIAADRAMAAIGAAARAGRPVPQEAITSLARVATRAPLRPEPFLAAGAQAQVEGDAARSERLFLAALARDPRSVAAHYFLADRYLRTGRIEQGLDEMAILGRLRPAMSDPLGPAIAAYGRSPGTAARLRAFFAREPELYGRVMSTLASDPANAGLIVSLSPRLPLPQSMQGDSGWPVTIVSALVQSGQIDAAERTWTVLSGQRRGAIVNDAGFDSQLVPPPFGWTLNGSAGGIVERAPGGGLSIVHYGREKMEFARQLLNLKSGRYRLTSRVAGGAPADSIAWIPTCTDGRELAGIPVGRSGDIVVPSGCLGPYLRLVGMPLPSPATVETRVVSVAIARSGQ